MCDRGRASPDSERNNFSATSLAQEFWYFADAKYKKKRLFERFPVKLGMTVCFQFSVNRDPETSSG